MIDKLYQHVAIPIKHICKGVRFNQNNFRQAIVELFIYFHKSEEWIIYLVIET